MLKPFQACGLRLCRHLVAVCEGALLILYLDGLVLTMIDPLKGPGSTRCTYSIINGKIESIHMTKFTNYS